MRTGKQWRSLYYSYLKQYDLQTKNLFERFKKDMTKVQIKQFKATRARKDHRLDYWQFRNAYTGTELQRIQEQEAGIRGKSINVMRDLLKQQQYDISYKQGRALTKAKREMLKTKIEYELAKKNPNMMLVKELRAEKNKLSVASMRMGLINTDDLKEAMRILNEQLKQDLDYMNDSYARAQEIGLQIFGS